MLLQPRSGLLAAYQRSLSIKHRIVLARWARGDFHVHDGRVTAAESAMETDEEDGANAAVRRDCPHPHLFQTWYQPGRNDEQL